MKKALNECNFIDGELLLIDKPYGWTSFGVVTQIKKWTKAKIGHAGTLDPLASGLMICCTGQKTKLLTALLGQKKEYTGVICLGASTPTFDLESEPENFKEVDSITDEMIENVRLEFIGLITQFPPIHSAIKQGGKPVYELAREGKEVTMKSREVMIDVFEITKIALPEVHFKIACGSGTYIRSIANDFGEKLGCGAYLQALIRTKIGEYCLEDAYEIDEMAAFFGSRMNAKIILPKINVQ